MTARSGRNNRSSCKSGIIYIEFNIETMRMELVSFSALLFNPVAQVKFVHTVASGYVTGAVFVLAISSFYLLKKRDQGFARRSFAIASAMTRQ